uniref:Uncharacterized protein n=1 Tax=Rhizophora mucronata TaxID=61149 RepID=A0A2P2P887_RHIMU
MAANNNLIFHFYVLCCDIMLSNFC